MYDYNFPEQLNQKRLTLLLLSQVIFTDTVVLKDIYKKKKELEIKDLQREVKILKHISNGQCFLLRQIRCLCPGFILYKSNEGKGRLPITVKVNPLKKLTLMDWFISESDGFKDSPEVDLFTKKLENRYSPRGIDIVNQIFEEYIKHNDISRPNCGYDSGGLVCWSRAPIWDNSTDLDYTINSYQHIDETLDERLQGFEDNGEDNGEGILVRERGHIIYF